jgi:hypothetical protein
MHYYIIIGFNYAVINVFKTNSFFLFHETLNEQYLEFVDISYF